MKLTKRDIARLRQALAIAIDSEVASVEAHQSQHGKDPWRAERQHSTRNVAAFRQLYAKLSQPLESTQ